MGKAVIVTVQGIQTVEVTAGGTVIATGSIPAYKGETTVTPEIGADIVLPTANKKMLSDVTVKEVPLFRTSNETGNTLYIGRKM